MNITWLFARACNFGCFDSPVEASNASARFARCFRRSLTSNFSVVLLYYNVIRLGLFFHRRFIRSNGYRVKVRYAYSRAGWRDDVRRFTCFATLCGRNYLRAFSCHCGIVIRYACDRWQKSNYVYDVCIAIHRCGMICSIYR